MAKKSDDFRGLKQESVPQIISMAVLCAKNAKEFNKQSAEILSKEFIPMEVAVAHHVPDVGRFWVQRFLKESKNDRKPLTKITKQFMIEEKDAESFNKAVEKAFEDGWEWIEVNPSVRYDAQQESFIFSLTLGQGTKSLIDLPYQKGTIIQGPGNASIN